MAAYPTVDVFVDPSKLTLTSATATHVTTTATMTIVGHGFAASDTVKVQGADQPEYNGNFVISNVTTDTFDYTMPADPLSNATGTVLCSKLNNAGDDGTTDALAYADLQYAIDNSTMSTGLQFNLKSSATNVLAGHNLALMSSATTKDPCVIRGYDAEPDDGGFGVIDGAGLYGITVGLDYSVIMQIRVHNCPTAFNVTNTGDKIQITGCEIHDCTIGISFNQGSYHSHCIGNYIHDCTDSGIKSGGGRGQIIYGNLLVNGATKKFTTAISSGNSFGHYVFGNLVHVDSTTNGIHLTNGSSTGDSFVTENSLYSSGTGLGISIASGNNGGASIGLNNRVQGFSTGIQCGTSTGEYGSLLNNVAAKASTQNYETLANAILDGNIDSPLDAFEMTGSLPTDFTSSTFWEAVHRWFAPTPIGRKSSYANPSRDIGASQSPVAGESTGFYYLQTFDDYTGLPQGMGESTPSMNDFRPLVSSVGNSWTTYAGAFGASHQNSPHRMRLDSADATVYGTGSYLLNLQGFDPGLTSYRITLVAHENMSSGAVFKHDPATSTFYMIWLSLGDLRLYYFNGTDFDSPTYDAGMGVNRSYGMASIEVAGSDVKLYDDSKTLVHTETLTNNTSATGQGIVGIGSRDAIVDYYAIHEVGTEFNEIYPPETVGRQPSIPHPLYMS